MTISLAPTPRAVTVREPLGRILLICGPDCSTALIGDHLQAASNAGNDIVVAFVEEPCDATTLLVDALTDALTPGVLERLACTGGPWNLTRPDSYVIAVLTALHIVIGERRRPNRRTPEGHHTSRSLQRLYTTPIAPQKEATS